MLGFSYALGVAYRDVPDCPLGHIFATSGYSESYRSIRNCLPSVKSRHAKLHNIHRRALSLENICVSHDGEFIGRRHAYMVHKVYAFPFGPPVEMVKGYIKVSAGSMVSVLPIRISASVNSLGFWFTHTPVLFFL